MGFRRFIMFYYSLFGHLYWLNDEKTQTYIKCSSDDLSVRYKWKSSRSFLSKLSRLNRGRDCLCDILEFCFRNQWRPGRRPSRRESWGHRITSDVERGTLPGPNRIFSRFGWNWMPLNWGASDHLKPIPEPIVFWKNQFALINHTIFMKRSKRINCFILNHSGKFFGGHCNIFSAFWSFFHV